VNCFATKLDTKNTPFAVSVWRLGVIERYCAVIRSIVQYWAILCSSVRFITDLRRFNTV